MFHLIILHGTKIRRNKSFTDNGLNFHFPFRKHFFHQLLQHIYKFVYPIQTSHAFVGNTDKYIR